MSKGAKNKYGKKFSILLNLPKIATFKAVMIAVDEETSLFYKLD